MSFFFDTKDNFVFNSIFVIFENFDVQKIIERLDINPNFEKQNKDYKLNFDMNFLFLHFTAYFFPYIKLKIKNFSKFSSKSHILLSLQQLLV